MRTIVVGSRQSALALTQTGQVIDDLKRLAKEHGLDYDFTVKKIVTKGDRILDVTLSKVGGKGLFVKEIEQAMLDGEIDMAVHSMKDMPSVLPEGLVSGAVPARKDPRDCLISKEGATLDDLPQGAKVGTSSLRRSSQLKAYRPTCRSIGLGEISIPVFAKWRKANFRPSFWRPQASSAWAGRTGSLRICRLKSVCLP